MPGRKKNLKTKTKLVAKFLLEIQIPLVGNYLDANLGLKGEFLRSLEYGENRGEVVGKLGYKLESPGEFF